MTILGIDPGTAITGWGVVEIQNAKIKMQNYGCIITSSKLQHSARLAKIFRELESIIKKERPDVLAIEKLFFIKNLKTAMSVGEARGVCMLVAEQKRLPIFEYTPLEVKQALTGYGKAEKKQIQMMVKNILRLKEVPKPDDAADALAIAITHAHCWRINEKIVKK